MERQPVEPGAPDPKSAPFVISLDEDNKPKQTAPLEPIPKTSAKDISAGPRTSVLAKNDELDWSAQIGDDAEMLAIAKAAGAHPGGARRVVLLALVVLVIGGLLGGALYGPEIQATVKRAMSDKKLRDGAILIKTTPSGAKVILDGEDVGKTNLKLTAVDPDIAHQLVVEPIGMDPIMIEFGPEDFQSAEDLPTFIWNKDFTKAALAAQDAGPSADAGPKKATKKKPTKRKRRGKRKRRR
jgi:hypothetical protein